ncbi:ABC transporter permease subunit [Robertmurraya sp. Marseille-Q9965]
MGSDFLKSSLVFVLIVIGFILLLLAPRIMTVHNLGGYYTPKTEMTYKENIQAFIHNFQTEGFGENRYGTAVIEELQVFIKRDLIIVIPAFVLSIVLGTFLGVIQFQFREGPLGKIQAFFSWIFSSVPDFFFYIAVQYLLIKLFYLGLPQFSLYGNDHWYSFILPMIAVMLYPMLHMSKFTLTSLENEVGQDYLRTAHAKGLQTLSVLKHMIWNCLSSLLNQTQFVMLYILTSLLIIEKLSSYFGAGYHLYGSIINNEDQRTLAFILPYLLLMFMTVILTRVCRHWLVPRKSGESR